MNGQASLKLCKVMDLKNKLRITKSLVTLISLVSIAILSIIFQGCEKEDFFYENIETSFEDNNLKNASIAMDDWQSQIDYMINNNVKFLEKNDIRLLKAEEGTAINSRTDIESYKSEILQEQNYIPLYKRELNSIILTTIGKIPTQYKSQYKPTNLVKYLSEVEVKNLKKVVLDWRYKDEYFSTICLVSDQEGIIYDNIISNIVILQPIEQNLSSSTSTLRLKSGSIEDPPTQNGPISFSKTSGATAYWLWGAERGEATVTVSATGEAINGTKYIYGHHEEAYDYITIGSSGSGTILNSFSTGSNGNYDVAWMWYLASPAITVNVTITNGSYTLDVSGILGSEGHGSGREYITPYHLN